MQPPSSPSSISGQQKYNSFLLASTANKELASKWDHYVLSLRGTLLMNREEVDSEREEYWYNIGVDTFAVEVRGGGALVLAQGDWLKACLGEREVRGVRDWGVVEYGRLSVVNEISFYYYIGENSIRDSQKGHKYSNQFIKITPKYILDYNCLIFQLSPLSLTQLGPLLHFKPIPSTPIPTSPNENYYNFRSDYALLSDLHFLNCLVRGRKAIGCYLKIGEDYFFVLDDRIEGVLERIYVRPRL